jgi:hypothetical protein
MRTSASLRQYENGLEEIITPYGARSERSCLRETAKRFGTRNPHLLFNVDRPRHGSPCPPTREAHATASSGGRGGIKKRELLHMRAASLTYIVYPPPDFQPTLNSICQELPESSRRTDHVFHDCPLKASHPAHWDYERKGPRGRFKLRQTSLKHSRQSRI